MASIFTVFSNDGIHLPIFHVSQVERKSGLWPAKYRLKFEYKDKMTSRQWRSQYRGKGAECPSWQRENCQKSGKRGKNREKRGKIEKKRKKSGRKGQNREGSFTLPLLTNRAGYATASRWLNHIHNRLKFDAFYTIHADICLDPLGMEDRRITDDQLQVSSVWYDDTRHDKRGARLNSKLNSRAWVAHLTDNSPWIRVSFPKSTAVSGVIIQGRDWNSTAQYVTKYKVSYSYDGSMWFYISSDGEPIVSYNTLQLYFKGTQMGHYVMVSLWCESLLTNTRFHFLYFRMNNC